MRESGRALWLGKKVWSFLVSLLVLSVVVFWVSRLAPGDPLVSYYGDRVQKMSPQERQWAQEKLGLDEPIPVQYLSWLRRGIQGDFGISYKYKTDALRVVRMRMGNTLVLGGLGVVLIFVLSILLGVFCAWHEDSLGDRIITGVGTVTSCIPEFWLSLVLILVFSVFLGWLPSSGAYSVEKGGGFSDRAIHLILPVTVVVISHLWYYAYMMRNKILEEVSMDYVLLARSKGLGRGKVLFCHCLPGALPSYLSMMAISVPHVMGGTYIVETVFSYPGLGTLAYESARYKDYNLLMLLSILSGAVVILCNMAAQAVNEKIDPRLKAREPAKDWEVRGL